MTKIQLLISDWSGVISDDRRSVYEANMRVVENHGIQRITFEEWLPRTQVSPREFFADMGVQGDGDALFAEYQSALARVKEDGIEPVMYPDAHTFLTTMRRQNREVAVVSAHPVDHVIREAHAYGLAGLIVEFSGGAKDKALAIASILVSIFGSKPLGFSRTF